MKVRKIKRFPCNTKPPDDQGGILHTRLLHRHIPGMRPVVLSGCAASDSAWGRRTLALVFQLNKSNNKKNNK